jgi:hypothetical protein
VVVGIDMGGTRDATAILVTRIRDGTTKLVGYFPGGGTDEEIHANIATQFATYTVWAMASDVAPRESLVSELEARWTPTLLVRMGQRAAIECDHRGSDQFFGRESERLRNAIQTGAAPWERAGTAGGVLRRDVLRVVTKENGRMGKVSAGAAANRIDAATAWLNSWIARRRVIAAHPGAFPNVQKGQS